MSKITYHRDATVTLWDVFTQTWDRTGSPSDKVLATLDREERARVMWHTSSLAQKIELAERWKNDPGVQMHHPTYMLACKAANQDQRAMRRIFNLECGVDVLRDGEDFYSEFTR